MEEITLSVFEMISSYGALGAVTIYFMYKDWKNDKHKDEVIGENTTALSRFTVATETLIKILGLHHNVEEVQHE